MRSTTVRVALSLAVALCLGLVPIAAAQTGSTPANTEKPATPADSEDGAKPPAELTFTTHLDKTAVWVGDQFHYLVFVDHAPIIQFIVDNLNKETVNLDPLRVIDVKSSTMPLKNGNERLVVDLTVSHLATGVSELQIPQLTLFYFRREGAAAAAATSEGAAAESLTVPGPVIGVRSTLPPRANAIRDAVTVTGWPNSRWVLPGIGWLAFALLAIGLAWEGVLFVRRRKRGEGPDPRKLMAAVRERWSQSVPGTFGDTNTVADFYGRSYHDLKEYLGYMLDTPTEGLMADEMRAEVGRQAATSDLADRTGRVLGICENARYARSSTDLSPKVAESVADDIRHIFDVGARM